MIFASASDAGVEDDEDSAITEVAPDLEDASAFLEVLSLLRRSLDNFRGKIRVVDVHALGGLTRRSHYRSQLIARALRHLGWERGRYRFDGKISYAYAKGTRLQRETILELATGDDDQLVVKRRES